MVQLCKVCLASSNVECLCRHQNPVVGGRKVSILSLKRTRNMDAHQHPVATLPPQSNDKGANCYRVKDCNIAYLLFRQDLMATHTGSAIGEATGLFGMSAEDLKFFFELPRVTAALDVYLERWHGCPLYRIVRNKRNERFKDAVFRYMSKNRDHPIPPFAERWDHIIWLWETAEDGIKRWLRDEIVLRRGIRGHLRKPQAGCECIYCFNVALEKNCG